MSLAHTGDWWCSVMREKCRVGVSSCDSVSDFSLHLLQVSAAVTDITTQSSRYIIPQFCHFVSSPYNAIVDATLVRWQLLCTRWWCGIESNSQCRALVIYHLSTSALLNYGALNCICLSAIYIVNCQWYPCHLLYTVLGRQQIVISCPRLNESMNKFTDPFIH